MKKLLAIILLLCSLQAHAFDDWDTTDKRLFIASEALLLADWLQTRQIVKNPDKYYETNPILGEHPSMGKVNMYFASWMIGNYLLADYAGDKYRTAYLTGVVGVQFIVVRNNALLGLKVAF